MFQFIYDVFGNDIGFLRIFNYVTFRALLAGLTSMFLSFFLGKRIIQYLYGLKFSETVRTDGVEEFAGVKSGPESSKFKWYFPFETDSIEREVLVLPSDQAPSLSVPV